MSNAPRPSKNVEKFLLNLKMNKAFSAKNIFTSGEAALKVYKKIFMEKIFIILAQKEIIVYLRNLKKIENEV